MRLAISVGLSLIFCFVSYVPSHAQGWPFWGDDVWGDRGWRYERSPRWLQPEKTIPRNDHRRLDPDSSDIRDGGPRPNIAPTAPPIVSFAYDFPVRSIVIDTGGRKLYYVLGDNRAYAYSISVGREGFNWAGVETVSRKQAWPDWHPPAEMRERDPSLPEKMTGGIKNPLGAMALYLGNTLYRIHGTNDVKSIGRAGSSGCFRMLNASVIHLASITEIGTTVSVVTSLQIPHQVSRAEDRPALGGTKAEVQIPPASSQPSSNGPDGSKAIQDYRSLRDYTLGTRP